MDRFNKRIQIKTMIRPNEKDFSFENNSMQESFNSPFATAAATAVVESSFHHNHTIVVKGKTERNKSPNPANARPIIGTLLL